jgi:hypothetical protein
LSRFGCRISETLNLGTSKKWIEAIESGKYVFGAGQLREESPQGDLYCALGVLADFVNPEGWKPHIIHGYQHDGEVFKLSADVAKRCKMKVCGSYITEDGKETDITMGSESYGGWDHVVYLIKTYYEQF